MNDNYFNDENNTINYTNQGQDQNPYIHTKKERKPHPFMKKLGVLALSGVLVGATAGGAFVGSSYYLSKFTPNSKSLSSSSSTTKNPVTLTSVSAGNGSSTSSSKDLSSVSKIASSCMPSIVAITNIGVTEVETFWGNMQQQSQSCGSGVIIGQTDDELMIVTNQHVINGSKNLTVVFSYDEHSDQPKAVEAYIKGYDTNKDLAVIAVSKDKLSKDVLSKISIATVGSSKDLVLGEQVVAIGNALGYGQSVTTGIVSALNRSISTTSSNSSNSTTNSNTNTNKYIQTDAAINPGNSGGALFNIKGELVGINSAKIASDSVEGMGYAIPISDVHDLIQKLMNETTRTEQVSEKDRGYLGISGTDVSSQIASTYGLPEGIYVSSVTEGCAADKAGIKKGYIITEFDGKSVSSISELQNLLSYYKAGEKVTVKASVQSSSTYEDKEFTVTLSSAKDVNIDTSSNSSNSNSSNNNSNSQTIPFFGDQNPFSDGSSSNNGGTFSFGFGN